jgi:hypothetical protein
LASNFLFEICPDSEDHSLKNENFYNDLTKLIFENSVISERKNVCIRPQTLSVILYVPNLQLFNHLTDCHKNLYKFCVMETLQFRISKFHGNRKVSMMELQFFLFLLFDGAVSNSKTTHRRLVGRLMNGEYERI